VSSFIEQSVTETQNTIREAGRWYAALPLSEAAALVAEFPSCVRFGQPVAFNLLPGLARLCVIKAYQQTMDQSGDLHDSWYAVSNRAGRSE
jgi:hypothetical protein